MRVAASCSHQTIGKIDGSRSMHLVEFVCLQNPPLCQNRGTGRGKEVRGVEVGRARTGAGGGQRRAESVGAVVRSAPGAADPGKEAERSRWWWWGWNEMQLVFRSSYVYVGAATCGKPVSELK